MKWFTRFSFADEPRAAADLLDPMFLGLVVLSFVTIGALVPLDRFLGGWSAYQRVNAWLEERRDAAPLVMRIGIGAALLLAWQAGSLLAPEMQAPEWLGWAQFAIVLLLLVDRTVPAAGIGLMALYAIVIGRAGLFHALDYVFYAGAGYYLATSASRNQRISGSGLPALYLTVGFALCWVALEKLIYPQWGTYVLQQHPGLSMGLDIRFFLMAAAFVEFSLGYLLIINLLQRPLALVITLVFFTTTMIFGKQEVIGHTPLHAALIVFLLEGPGATFAPPIALHRRMGLRTAFAAVNFLLLLAVMTIPYAYGARRVYQEHATEPREVP